MHSTDRPVLRNRLLSRRIPWLSMEGLATVLITCLLLQACRSGLPFNSGGAPDGPPRAQKAGRASAPDPRPLAGWKMSGPGQWSKAWP
jgi:hypothetical protein